MALQHLRSGVANKRPIPTIMSEGQIALNTNEASPGLFFKDSNGDLVKIGPVHVGTSAPNSSPASTAATALVTGATYQILTVGTSDFTLVGASANTVGTIFTATGTTTGTGTVSGQQGVEKGEQWLDTTGGNYVLKIYDGTAWRSEAGEFVNITGDTMTGALLLDNAASASAPDLSFDGDANTGVYSPGADQFGVATGGTSRLVIDSSGRLLVGTSNSSQVNTAVFQGNSAGGSAAAALLSSTTSSPSSTQVLGKLVFADSGHVDAASIKCARDSGTWTSGSSQPSALTFLTTPDGASSPTERMTIDSSGRLLVGTSSDFTNGTGTKIQSVDSAGGQIALGRDNSSLGSSSLVGRLRWYGNSGGTAEEVARISVESDSSHALGDKPGRITFHTTADDASSPTERMRIDSSGNVGVGTTSPGSILEVKDTASSSITIRASTGAGNLSNILFRRDGSSGDTRIRSDVGNDTIEFISAASERMRIDSSGNVGIGTTSPDQILDVRGVLQIKNAGTTTLRFNDSTTNYWDIQNDSNLRFSRGGSEYARIDSSGRLLVGTTSSVSSGGGDLLEVASGVGNILITSTNSTRVADQACGQLRFWGKAGADEELAKIAAVADGTHGAGDKPTRLTFSVTADGASSPTERVQIKQNGQIRHFVNSTTGYMQFATTVSGIYGALGTSGGDAYLTAGSGGTDSVDLIFRTAASGTESERMRIDSSGNVAIGTTSPDRTLHVRKDDAAAAKFGGESGGDYAIEIGQLGTGSSPGFNATGGSSMLFRMGGSEAMRIDSSGNVGIGTTSPQGKLTVSNSGAEGCEITPRTSYIEYLNYNRSTSSYIEARHFATSHVWTGPSGERARIDSSGNVGIGTTSPGANLEVKASSTPVIRLNQADTYYAPIKLAGNDLEIRGSSGSIEFYTGANNGDSSTKRVVISPSGNFSIGTVNPTNSTYLHVKTDGGTIGYFDRLSSDGTLIEFRRASSAVGSISVSSGTVSYNPFLGSHWARLEDNSKPNIPVGTVLETVDKLVDWQIATFSVDGEEKVAAYHGPAVVGDTVQIEYEGVSYDAVVSFEDDPTNSINKHVCVKVSDTAASSAVYGVFLGWDEDVPKEMISTWNDLYCAAVGNYFIRIAAAETVAIGDLIESDGNGCGVVQADDIIRSKTVGKVTSTIPQEIYADGSFLVTCVLCCG